MKRYIFAVLLLLSGLGLWAQNSKEFKFNAFRRIVLDFPAKVQIVYSPTYSIRVIDSSQSRTAVLFFDQLDRSLDRSSIDLDKFSISQHDSTLYISSHQDLPTHSLKIRIIISMPLLEKIKVETAASIVITGKFNLPYLAMDLEGASSIKILDKPIIKQLSIKDEGASYVYLRLKHPIDFANFDVEGASFISALETPIHTINANIEGASMCKVYPLETLNVTVEGMSYFQYKGRPKQTHIKSEGLSIIKQAD